jgi:hypothetical protein
MNCRVKQNQPHVYSSSFPNRAPNPCCAKRWARGEVPYRGACLLALIRLTIICCRNFEGRHKIPHFCVAVPSAVVAWGLGMLVQEIIHEEIAWMVFFVVWLGL